MIKFGVIESSAFTFRVVSLAILNTCYVWPIDCGPARDFPCSVSVCIIRVSTSHADKLRLAFSVSLVDASALATGARSVPCVNELDRDAGTLGLVQDKLLQLAKRPTVQTTALLFISPFFDSVRLQISPSPRFAITPK